MGHNTGQEVTDHLDEMANGADPEIFAKNGDNFCTELKIPESAARHGPDEILRDSEVENLSLR